MEVKKKKINVNEHSKSMQLNVIEIKSIYFIVIHCN